MPRKSRRTPGQSIITEHTPYLLEEPEPTPPELDTLIRESGLDILYKVLLRRYVARGGWTPERLREEIEKFRRTSGLPDE